MVLFLLNLAMLMFSFSCKGEVDQTYLTDFQNKTNLTDVNSTINISGLNGPYTTVTSSNIARLSVNKDLYTPEPTNRTTATLKMAPEPTKMTTIRKKVRESTKINTAQYTTTKRQFWSISEHVSTHSTNTPPNTSCACKEDRYKTGIMICAIIIALLVLICAVLIICSVALANKVSNLRTKLTQSKRQARSNGDFLSASSILWPSGMDTWQKKSQIANQTMDEISLGEPTISDEKHKLMTVPTIDKLKNPIEDKTTSINDLTTTIVSTVEV